MLAGICLAATALALAQGGCTPSSRTASRTGSTPAAVTGSVRLRSVGVEPASAITEAFTRRLPGLLVETDISVSGFAGVVAIERGEADLGVAWADASYTAHVVDGARSPLRALASLNAAPHFLLVHAGSGIRRITDLPGHRVRLTSTVTSGGDPRFRLPFRRRDGEASPAAYPGVSSFSELILSAFGIRPTAIHVTNIQPAESLDALRTGAVEAYFTNAPSDEMVRDATNQGARLVPIDGAPIDELRQRYPFIQPIRVPAGTYAGQDAPLHTVGIGLVLVCRADLDADLAYRLTRAFISELEQNAGGQGALGRVALDRAAVTPIPLHPGAARAYREWELFR
jgi:TRAP-type uncharacterized transport system substrate-binding protein